MEPNDTTKTLQTYREELKGWKLTALQLTANGRFKGYEPTFLAWVNQLAKLLRSAHTSQEALHEFVEARRRIDIGNDDLFPDICARLERTLVLAEEVVYGIPEDILQEFKGLCDEEGIDPNAKTIELIQFSIRERRNGAPSNPSRASN